MKIRVDKRKWHLAIINAVLILLVLFCLLIFESLSDKLLSVDAAHRWRNGNEMRFVQIGCFLPVDEPKSETDILQFRRTLDQKLVDASLEAAPNGSLYSDAYSGEAKLTVKGEHGNTDVKAIGVGGNFFLFHPLQLLSGSYLYETDLMQDRVVLDETVAWQLFGGSNVAGQSVTIQGETYYVAGVVRRESDFASKEAYVEGAGIFLSYSALQKLTQAGISCYEIVLPDMISGFGLSLVKENFSVGTGDIVQNTGRFSVSGLIDVIGSFGSRSMRNNGVIYPYWENAVRMIEDYLALLLVLMTAFAICPVVCGIVLVVRLTVRSYRTAAKRIPAAAVSLQEHAREKKYAKRGED